MATPKTRDELLDKAGRNLGLTQPGEALAPEDKDTLDDYLDPLIDQLAADSVIYVQDLDAIENEIFLPLASLLANTAGPDFGSPINDAAKARDEATLRRISTAKATTEPLKAVYY